tara:strand:+ start:47667 stop:48398 length:732 start_codon:yes stop_codon:yes gene_type:complete
MLNILIPMAGESKFFSDTLFPKPLFEIKTHPMVRYPIHFFSQLKGEKKFLFIVNQQDCDKYHLDKTLKLLAPESEVVVQSGPSSGAACSCLLAIEHFNTKDPLIISNFDHYFDISVEELFKPLMESNADGGLICFDSVHPQWSFAKTNSDGFVNQTAEKMPISRNAIAGTYYFKHGEDFARAAMKMILKDSNVNGFYYNSQVFNELILEGKKIQMQKIPAQSYHSFYSIERIKEFESHHSSVI